METNNDKVSIIIPVYNSEIFLTESIESVLNQTYKNIEIIAVNDGSTDNSLRILKQYSEKIIIVSQKNQGLAAALNTGITKMNGVWFKWFSPDDVLHTNAIEILVKQIKSLPENSIVYSNWDIVDEHGKKIRDFHESNFNSLTKFDFNTRLLDGQQINVNTTLIPFSLFKKNCLFQNLSEPVGIDYDFFLRAGIYYDVKFFLIEKNLISYRIHSNQLSHQNIINSLNFIEEIKKKILLQLSQTEQRKYLENLKQLNKNKSIRKKIIKLGLEFSKEYLPNSFTNQMLLFYLNKIRHTR